MSEHPELRGHRSAFVLALVVATLLMCIPVGIILNWLVTP